MSRVLIVGPARVLLALAVATLAGACGDDAEDGSGGAGGAGGQGATVTAGGEAGSTAETTTTTTTTTGTGGAGGDGGGGGGEPLTPEEALEATVAALCPGYAERYCAAATGDTCGCVAAPGFPDTDACLSAFETRCRRELASYLSVVEAGQAEYHPEAAPECFAALEPLIAECLLLPSDIFFVSCPILSPPGGFGPLPGEGEPCDLPCAAGLRCDVEGLCRTPGGEGDACGFLPDCAPDLTCNLPPDGGDGTCAALDFTGRGDACTGPAECTGDNQCFASVRKECVEPEPGIACTYDTECRVTEYCAPSPDGGSGSCTPAPGVDEPCGNGVTCEAGLGCNLETVICAALPEEGAPCAAGPDGPFLCAAGLGCFPDGCAPLPGLGEECSIGLPSCQEGLACAFEQDGSFCREPVGAGSPCQNDFTCEEGLFCNFDDGMCRPHLPVGTPCALGNECGPEGACLPDATFTFRCAPAPGEGDACFLDECTGDLRCKTPFTEGACVPEVFCGAIDF